MVNPHTTISLVLVLESIRPTRFEMPREIASAFSVNPQRFEKFLPAFHLTILRILADIVGITVIETIRLKITETLIAIAISRKSCHA